MKRFCGMGILMLILVPSWAFGGGLEFRGNIGDSLKIVMTLRFSEGKVLGYYYYAKFEKEKCRPYMKVQGTMDDTQNISIEEIDMKKGVTGHLKGRFINNKTIEGEWSNADGSRKMPFSVSTSQGVDEKDATGLTRLQASGLDAQHLATNPEILKKLYTLKKSQTLNLDGVDIVVELYLKKDQKEDDEEGTFLYRIQSGKSITAFTQDGWAEANDGILAHKVEILNTTPKLLSIVIPAGGNSWNGEPTHLIDLEKGYFLKYLGHVTDATVNDKDGQIELHESFDRFESNSIFCHADSPGEWVFYKVKDGMLVRDTAKNEKHWKKSVAQADQELAKAAPEAKNRNKEATNQGLLAAIKKLICAHLSGQEKEGWVQFHKDILSLSSDGNLLFGDFLNMSENGLKITDVEKELREGFQCEDRDKFLKDL